MVSQENKATCPFNYSFSGKVSACLAQDPDLILSQISRLAGKLKEMAKCSQKSQEESQCAGCDSAFVSSSNVHHLTSVLPTCSETLTPIAHDAVRRLPTCRRNFNTYQPLPVHLKLYYKSSLQKPNLIP